MSFMAKRIFFQCADLHTQAASQQSFSKQLVASVSVPSKIYTAPSVVSFFLDSKNLSQRTNWWRILGFQDFSVPCSYIHITYIYICISWILTRTTMFLYRDVGESPLHHCIAHITQHFASHFATLPDGSASPQHGLRRAQDLPFHCGLSKKKNGSARSQSTPFSGKAFWTFLDHDGLICFGNGIWMHFWRSMWFVFVVFSCRSCHYMPAIAWVIDYGLRLEVICL